MKSCRIVGKHSIGMSAFKLIFQSKHPSHKTNTGPYVAPTRASLLCAPLYMSDFYIFELSLYLLLLKGLMVNIEIKVIEGSLTHKPGRVLSNPCYFWVHWLLKSAITGVDLTDKRTSKRSQWRMLSLKKCAKLSSFMTTWQINVICNKKKKSKHSSMCVK